MSDSISSDLVPGSIPVRMSNGLIAVVLEVLAIAASDLAQTAWQRALACWMVEHDQGRIGGGCVGFDVAEMGWTRDGFDAEKAFVIAVVDAALQRRGWERLPYSPHEGLVLGSLAGLRLLVEALSVEVVGQVGSDAWVPDVDTSLGKCAQHGVLMHEGGCIVCNGAPVDAPTGAAPNRGAPRVRR